MSPFLEIAFVGIACAAGQKLSTDYTQERTLRIETKTAFELETTEMSIERDGEPMERPAGGPGGMSISESLHTVHTDRVLEHEDGAPRKVRRHFETLAGKATFDAGGEARETEREAPLEGLTLEVGADGKVEVVEGDAPKDGALLEGHALALALDALLPAREVAPGDSWEVEDEALMQALGFDVRAALFPERARDEAPPARGGERGRRGGGGGQRASLVQMFRDAKWEAKATLGAEDEEHDGLACAVIELAIKGTGALPEPRFGGGRGGRRALSLASPALESNFEIELEGKLYVSRRERRPVALELEGEVEIDTHIERETGQGTMVIDSRQEGTFTHSATLRSQETDQ